jgi:ATP-binding cassette subfamily F protein 3
MVVDSVRQYLSRFRFWGDDPFRNVGSLSGGEKTRLALAKLLLVPRNVLFLDEPTNHLDIPACEILEEALVRFEGTVVLVSHDRYFLERVTTRVLHLDNGEATLYSGTYGEYVAHRAKSAAGAAARKYQSEVASSPPARSRRDEATKAATDASKGKSAYETAKRNAREAERKVRRVAELDKLMADGQEKLTTLRSELQNAPGDNWERLAQLAEQEQKLVRSLDNWTEEWMRLSEET